MFFPEAVAFQKLQKVKDKHNNLIFEAERERNKLEIVFFNVSVISLLYRSICKFK